MNPRFAADRMVGRLARMLRLLGYDTFYSASITPPRLEEIASRENRVILTRGGTSSRFSQSSSTFSVRSEYAPEQLREVVREFSLNPRGQLWTRCTICNSPLTKVSKESVEFLVPPKVLDLYDEFYQCAGCRHVYWRGSHAARIRQNLVSILGREL